MGDVEELKRLVDRMANAATTMQEENAKLIRALAERPAAPVHAAAPPVAPVVDPAVARGEKMAKVNLALRKSAKVKDFKET